MIRIIAQAILSAAGVIVAFFIPKDDFSYPIYQLVVSLLMIALAAVLVWYGPRLISRKE
ncbi:hypothetical protein [Agrobacterium sp. CNPSo 2736]|uniref:hypothetical protein n=1 Tax=Agrobacterium sp. CNPSo 2736 TaxID=2499627 RepID=UPI0013E2ED49|nr:hypothetical protein [Agrobacterium sp. CNPSo 2736]